MENGDTNTEISGVVRIHTDPGKVCKVMEFKVEFFQALKSLENGQRYGKIWENP